ncbi:Fibroblast growth factor 4 [Camelus dromedarius]|uniref:Fibroblast growth factor 4 n=1 Tax=Camelus dromedarius TaxID=9838 RepID=A0A5N4BYL5_CAMDR|nr:Fibroblast growth factor 4 [Camelus dromedarius]
MIAAVELDRHLELTKDVHLHGLDLNTLGDRQAQGGCRPERRRDYLLGIKRLRTAYCNVGIGFHLQFSPTPHRGVHADTRGQLLSSRRVERGVVSIFGWPAVLRGHEQQGQALRLAFLHRRVQVQGNPSPQQLQRYECFRHPGMFIALSKNGKDQRGSRVSPHMKVTHFLPRL